MSQKKARYEMHKYWGKKPSHDLESLITKYSEKYGLTSQSFNSLI